MGKKRPQMALIDNFIKTIFMAICILFIVAGIFFLTLGSILTFVPGKVLTDVFNKVKDTNKVTRNYTLPHTVEEIQDMPMIYEIGLTLFIFGAVLSGLSFMGSVALCCACCSSQLLLFAMLMLCLMVGETFVVSMFLEHNSPLHDKLRSSLKEKVKAHYKEDGKDPFSKVMNMVQKYFQCCGIDGVSDFKIKPSFCVGRNTLGCYTKLRNIVRDHYKVAYVREIFAAILLLQLTQVTAAAILF